MNYTPAKSTKLTLAITFIYCALLLVLTVGAYPMLLWFFGQTRIGTIKVVTAAFYLSCPAAWTALVCVINLLKNIISQKIFTPKTVSFMRILSWCCAFVSVVCFVLGMKYVPLFIFALGAAFMMLILRVLKNVMAQAVEMKDENELTI